MAYLDYEKYKTLEKGSKIKELNQLWKTEQILKGWIKNISPERGFITIDDITNLDNEGIRNPFNEKIIERIICFPGKNSILYEKIHKYDQIVFKFDINRNNREVDDKDSEKNSPIIADAKTIRIIDELEEIYNKLIEEDIELTFAEIVKKEYANKSVVFCEDIINLFKDKNDSVINDISKRQNELSKLDNEIMQKQNEILKFTSLLSEEKVKLEKQLNEIRENKLIEINKELEDKKNSIVQIETIAKKYEKIGFNLYWDSDKYTNETEGRVDIKEKLEQIEYIQKYLGIREDKKLYYDRHIIEMLFSALCSNQIIVLCGEPGTGKTSLVEGFAEAISAEYRLVSVQPNWTDNQDLLGFYNPVEKTYVATPFLDAILEANKYPERLFLICLDEMNLAHVEYYFSEFLSKLQSKVRTLNLYSDYIYKQIGLELHGKIKKYISGDIDIEKALSSDLPLLQLSSNEIDEYFKLKWQWNMFRRYTSNVKIPNNIRFIGTINKDETTKGLSPKVVDRSFVIELGKFSEHTKIDIIENEEEYKKLYNKNLYLSANYFGINRYKVDEEFLQRINSIKEILKKLKIYLNNRFDDQIEQIIGSGIINDYDRLFDYVVSCMVLPKINISIDDDQDKQIVLLQKQLKDTKISKSIFAKMKEYCDQEHILTFWR
ncbi:hypothetical protein CFOLD11_11670 [Clostridium folliculivorans]|uniref:AAA+ ATPase domain-containing protein n=1 Tax=Clostridium folliculivorans TaxID=2886038 RepID=A0A9W5Y0J2_9CLOT|nr:AAA family ATPase [Clostridium folliculivorans]GKU24341.1 hypothetical protein CFOLD11_11670 [Clostridium folliculivorans]